jgi:hypothetical protein
MRRSLWTRAFADMVAVLGTAGKNLRPSRGQAMPNRARCKPGAGIVPPKADPWQVGTA